MMHRIPHVPAIRASGNLKKIGSFRAYLFVRFEDSARIGGYGILYPPICVPVAEFCFFCVARL